MYQARPFFKKVALHVRRPWSNYALCCIVSCYRYVYNNIQPPAAQVVDKHTRILLLLSCSRRGLERVNYRGVVDPLMVPRD